MKNVIANWQNAASGFPAAPPTRERGAGISKVSLRVQHDTQGGCCGFVFVFQVPAPPVGVTGSFEVLAFAPVPRLISL